MKNMMQVVGGVILMAVALWGFFYQYYVWPCPGGQMVWWTIPQTITAGATAFFIGGIGFCMVDDILG